MPPRLLRPAILRPLVLRPGHVRNFHCTRPQAIFLDTTTTLLTDLHSSTHLSWSLLIPCAAVTLRVLFTLPLTLYSRSKMSTIISLLPLTEARTLHHARELRGQPPHIFESTLRKVAKKSRNQLWARWGCQQWKLFLPLLQIPVWVAASASLRALMPGAADDSMVSFFGGLTNPAEVAREAAGLATEGFGWVQDLTATDPTLALPVMFGAAVLANVRYQAYINPPQSTNAKRISNALTVMTVPMFVVSCGMPSGLVLYWASSAMWSLGLTMALQRYRKLPEKVGRCKVEDLEDVDEEKREDVMKVVDKTRML
ncbi:60Kd inner membrane protein-domain-containing protein [Pyronema omphalodes]|nr:60Kd inner membrane protein-domain-containing protein [Pyronema omphalodes]